MTLKPRGQWAVAPFVRYERLDTQDEVPAGFEKDPSLDRTVVTAGVGVKPLANVVLKADYQWYSDEDRRWSPSSWPGATGWSPVAPSSTPTW
jgi:hypothetical protein